MYAWYEAFGGLERWVAHVKRHGGVSRDVGWFGVLWWLGDGGEAGCV